MPRRLNKKLIFILLVIAAGYAAYTHFMPQGPGGWGQQGGAMPVDVAEVIERDVRLWSEFSGRLVAVEHADIRPRVSGVIESIHFEDGAMVKKGDLLFIIDPRPFEASLAAARARDVLADSEFDRARTLMKDKAISSREFEQRKNAAAVARADFTRARLDLEYTHIKAPISGKAGRAEITAGNMVEAVNAPVLTSIVSISPIYADFEVDENTYLQSARAGDGAPGQIPVMMGLASETGTPHQGTIQAFDNRIDSGSGTIRVRAVFDNDDGMLLPGLFARIKLGAASETRALLITDRAIGTDQSKKFVLVVGPDNKTERREIKLGSLSGGMRIVTDGLKPGEKIIVSGMQRVMMPGQPVTPQIVEMDPGFGIQDSGEKKEKKENPPEPDADKDQKNEAP